MIFSVNQVTIRTQTHNPDAIIRYLVVVGLGMLVPVVARVRVEEVWEHGGPRPHLHRTDLPVNDYTN